MDSAATKTLDPREPWQKESLEEVRARLDAREQGLDRAEATRRLKVHGPNRYGARRQAWLGALLSRFRNPLIIILLLAGAASAATGDVASFVILTAVLSISIVLDFAQEYRADRAIERLRARVTVRVRVRRDGQPREIAMAEVVPGDVVELTAGSLVPGDGRVLETDACLVNESLMTGEPYPTEKHATRAGGADAVLYMGTSVVSGNALMLVCETGGRTALGRMAETLQARAPATAFERGTRRFGAMIMRLTMLMVLAVLLINSVFHRPLLESLLFAIALAVGLTPELLPMIVTVTLARGALRMARKSVVVKRLSAVQDLGAMDVLCTDKTGTLTEARIRLERHVDIDGHEDAGVLRLAALASRYQGGLRGPLDAAIMEHAGADGEAWEKTGERPFEADRRRASVLLRKRDTTLLIVKGAPEEVLPLCSRYECSAERPTLDDTARNRAMALFDDLSSQGLRVLAVSSREMGRADSATPTALAEGALVFAGFVVFYDPPKATTAAALRSLARDGVRIKIVTGDNERVTRHLCGQLGITITEAMNGADINTLDDVALRARVERANVFCRISPAQKTRIVLALKGRHHTVGFLGDGVNDAPSLHLADVGVSVDSATDVAKEAAALILLERDLRVLHEGVREGRRSFGNVQKYIMMATSSNFGNMFSMAAATVVLPFLPMLPVQILLNNLLYDISEIPIPFDRVDEGELRHPREWDMRFIRNFMWLVGPVSSVFDFVTFYVLLRVFGADDAFFRTGWFVESVATQVLVIFVIRTRGSWWRSRPQPWLFAMAIAVVSTAALVPLSPLARFFGFVALPPAFYGFVLVVVATYLLLVNAVKGTLFGRHKQGAMVS